MCGLFCMNDTRLEREFLWTWVSASRKRRYFPLAFLTPIFLAWAAPLLCLSFEILSLG